ncbi:Zinc finger protein 276 [Larimichthys crocea]|uniref:Zinc finger protein 276 n=1 Tax=Larimichthys crocea TaxID=215358 RepID=A0A6G0IWQ5_LARCR|nr:Zinc finger protein 276 [Larimichthys crocea]
MKKKSRRGPRSNRTTKTASISEAKRPPGNRGRPRKTLRTQKHPESKSKSSGRLSAAVCRLCHGKFSPRSLRHAFNTWPQDSIDLLDDESDAAAQSPLLFHTDFQRLVGVRLDRDPRLSEFICKKCHAKFYKCHSILIRFLQRVNLPPVGKESVKGRKNAKCPESSANHGSAAPPSFTSDPKCLHSLVSWAHHHGEACRSCPDLKEVLEGGTGEEEDEDEQPGGGNGRTTAGGVSAPAQTHWSSNTEDFQGHEEALSPAPVQLEDRTADSDLSDRVISEDDFDVGRKGLSDDELFEPFSDKRPRRVSVPNKRRRNPKASEEPKIKKKPGPKPGWKNKFKPKGEELPNIYKCPYQGCTAVYRAPDGLKKHIKEHHEEVRERPCPHPGCNKVFMIDRYLQRHVKLIHTEERNYICDQCGQTFKQRKHLSVHQMRHSGAKPLQCEVCGFQCRQRASLKYHMTKHKAEADLEFACLMCGKRFEKAHNLNVHMSMVHPLTQAEAQRGGGGQQQQQQ